MNRFEEIPSFINSAYALNEWVKTKEAKRRLESEKSMREQANVEELKRMVEELKRMVEELTRQNEFLRAEAKRDVKWKWIATILAVIGTIGTILSVIL